MEGINTESIFSDGTKQFLSPAEPLPYDTVTVTLRTANQEDLEAFIVVGEERTPMEIVRLNERFLCFQGKIYLDDKTTRYCFEIRLHDEIIFFDKRGVQRQMDEHYKYVINPGFSTPKWAKGAVFYQIYVDRFYNGDSNTTVVDNEYVYIGEHVKRVKDWSKYPASMGVREFYGGDLEGVRKKLDYLKDLGVEVLYLNPIFVSPSNHKYDTQDYDYIDPHLTVIMKDEGEPLADNDYDNRHASKYQSRVVDKTNLEASNAYFAQFVEEVHAHGMKVILDGVFNHCGSFNKWIDRERIYEGYHNYEPGAYVSKDSPYRSFFHFHKNEDDQWPYNNSYDGWWGHDTLPKLNYEESEKLVAYIMRIAKKWIAPPYNVDGWRLDVAADLGRTIEYNHDFWKRFRKTVKETNPDALILAEHYGNPAPWLGSNEWDSVMNYDAFMEPVSWYLTGMEKHSDLSRDDLKGDGYAFYESMIRNMGVYPMNSLQVAMTQLSNHDHSRFLTRTNGMVGRVNMEGPESAEQNIQPHLMRNAIFLQMTWHGAPTLYYGDEAGVCGWTDPDNRRTFPWGKEDKTMFKCYKELIRIHKDYDCLHEGSLLLMESDKGYVSYARFDAQDCVITAVNMDPVERSCRIPIWKTEVNDGTIMVRLAKSTRDNFTTESKIYRVLDGYMTIHMEPEEAVIIKNYHASWS